MEDLASIASVSKRFDRPIFRQLTCSINNAGIMQPDDAVGVIDDAVLTSPLQPN